MHNFPENHIDYGMEHVVYLMVKKGNKGNREPVSVERLQLEQMSVSRVTLLEAYLEAWQQPSHVCGVIRDKIQERYMEERSGSGGESSSLKPSSDAEEGHSWKTAGEMGLRDMHRCFPDYQVWDRSFQRYLQRHQLTREWLRVWRIPVFDGWGVSEQLSILMKWTEGWQKLSQILVLGYDPGLLVWLPELARRSRGIHFYLDYAPRDMEEIQDWIYEEYGLMTQWQVLEGGAEAGTVRREETDSERLEPRTEQQEERPGFRIEAVERSAKMAPYTAEQQPETAEQEETGRRAERPEPERAEQRAKRSEPESVEQRAKRSEPDSAERRSGTAVDRRAKAYQGLSQYLRSYPGPCLVIDLTGTADISVTGLKPGSMWWDLGSMEEKRHLLEDRPLGTQYFSLQTLWRDMPAVTGT